ncbi:sensor histidine kinase [Sphingomonas xinjiangensis]|uniref:histidine kinase n=1 Tax=Sphingomonas xinjiangensis TaxID=643568 RepID=A0A840YES0_9SPHN|nr:ATP-binding protein [Sphingomonas xinjiangensis]MBB5709268.1 two-component system C4-dicarboxylate transport sensor histidine kinase DctB [Sphingomonas xinjiangensis]
MLRWVLGTMLLSALAVMIAGSVAEKRVLADLREQAVTDARLRAALLDSELARFRLLPLTLADDRDVIAAVNGVPAAREALDRKLELLAGVTRAAAIYVIAPDGTAVSASNWRSPESFKGMDYRFRPYFQEAKARGEASQYALGTVSHRPGLYLARRSAGQGVIVVKLEFDRIEQEWARAGGITFVRNPLGVVLVTSRPDWRFAASQRLTPATAARFRRETRVPIDALRPLPIRRGARDVRVLDGGGRFVAREVAVAQSGWQLTLMQPVNAAVRTAQRAAALSAALAAVMLSVLGWTLTQRVTLARRRTAELEDAVAQRTADLRREMDERAESEARAAELRDALRQANRLASLGQITASVAHETAQPVAAIRTYAQTSGTLLDRGALEDVRANLGTIARLADRIGSVTAHLRGFSRRQSGEVRPVLVSDVVDGALLILKEQLRSAAIDLPAIPPALAVLGGKVRLEQVLVNLIQNALEAMAGMPERRITLALSHDATHVRLTVADGGPGVADDVVGRLFTPFVTSRDKGLGLGLVISQDIMVELGGWLKLLPSAGGARFEVGMRRA